MIRKSHAIFALMCALGLYAANVSAQTEVSGWGNLRGIRVGDQLVPFVTALGIYKADFTTATLSQREGPTRTTRYSRDGNTLTVAITLQNTTRNGRGAGPATNPATVPSAAPAATAPALGPRGGGRGAAGASFNFTLAYTDSAPGVCDVSVRANSATAQTIGGLYYFLTLPMSDFAGASVQIVGSPGAAATALTAPDEHGRYLSANGTAVRVTTKENKTIEAIFPQPLDVVVQQARGRNNTDIQVYFPIVAGNVAAGQPAEATFTLKASGTADTTPATITIDPSKTGRPFAGIGGNYRIQSQRPDALHSQYIFDNMRVAWGRVAMPWNTWQPLENAPPPMMPDAAPGQTPPAGGRGGGGAMNSVPLAMEIAQTLARKNIPMIISCWSPPAWAVLPANNGAGGRGEHLDPAKWDAICQSIGSYLFYLRDHFGAEPVLFSFNESNAGINVKQTPEEHAEAIRKLGAHFKAIGLKTKMLLGDTGDVPPISFIQPAMNDPEAVKYIGAVAFHSWRGATDEQYKKWADAADQLAVPLFDAEGGNDAQAYSYANIFREEWYALDEAAEYVRIMRICQPESILQWQFTQNYSVLWAGPNGALQPTQRFFNLKQMNLTPAGSAWVDVKSDSSLILPAAFVDKASGIYTIHLVNNGAMRPVTINGLPDAPSRMNVYVTDKTRGVEKLAMREVQNGSSQLTLPARSLVTLIVGGTTE